MIRRFFSAFPSLALWMRLPALSAWLWLSAGIVVGMLFHQNFTFPLLSFMTWGKSAAVIAASAALFCRKACIRYSLFLACGFFLVSSSFSRQHNTWERWWQSSDSPQLYFGAQAQAIGNSIQHNGSFHTVVRLDSISNLSAHISLRGKSIVCVTYEPLPHSAQFFMRGLFTPPKPSINPGGFDQYTYYLYNGLWGTFYADSVHLLPCTQAFYSQILRSLRSYTMSSLGKIDNYTCRTLMQAAFLGEIKAVTDDIKDGFRQAGIYHLLALSGFHVALVISFVWAILFFIPLPRECKILAALASAWLYLALVGLLPSLFRATVMATVLLVAMLLQRRSIGLNALGVAGITWLFFSPESIVSPAYQLSFSATAGLIILTPVFSELSDRATQRIPALKPPLKAFYVTLACFLATAPVIAYHFGSISLFGFIANLAAGGLMAVSLWSFLFVLLIGLILPYATQSLVFVTQCSLQGLIEIAKIAQQVSWSTMEVARPRIEMLICAALFLTGLAAIRRELRLRFALSAIACCLLVSFSGTVVRHFSFKPQIVFFSTPRQKPLMGVVTSSRKVLVVGWDKGNKISSTYRFIIAPWIRTLARPQLNAVIFQANDNLTTQAKAVTEVCRPHHIVIVADSAKKQLVQETYACIKQIQSIRYSIIYPGDSISYDRACTFYIHPAVPNKGSGKKDHILELRISDISILMGDSCLMGNQFGCWNQKDTSYIAAIVLDNRKVGIICSPHNAPNRPALYMPLRQGSVTVYLSRKKGHSIRTHLKENTPHYAALQLASF